MHIIRVYRVGKGLIATFKGPAGEKAFAESTFAKDSSVLVLF